MFTNILTIQSELLVLSLLLMMLYGNRHLLGPAPLFITVGIYYIFAVTVDSPRIANEVVTSGLFEYIGSGILWLPFLLLLVVIYELEGISAAQRFYVGLIVANVGFVSLVLIIFRALHENSPGHLSNFYELLNTLFTDIGGVNLLIGISTHLFLCILVPTAYQMITNRKYPFGVSIFTTLLIYLVSCEAINAIHTALISSYKDYIPLSPGAWTIRITTVMWLSLLGHCFLKINLIGQQKTTHRGALSFISGFVNYFFSSDNMKRSLDEWSERYQIVLENSSELILVTDTDGKLLNANQTAVQAFTPAVLNQPGFDLGQFIKTEEGEDWNWRSGITPEAGKTEAIQRNVMQYRNLFLRIPERPELDLDINVSSASLNGRNIAIVIARDMTIQRTEERRQRDAAEKIIHSQRLEAIGQLAGGIAHDFNNLIHSALASLETLKLRFELTNDAQHLIDNVDDACQRATTLTSQLLGFAHKGKYDAVDVSLPDLIDRSLRLFLPSAGDIQCRQICEPVPLVIHGDPIQLSQVILNILLNARDALEGVANKRITIRGEAVRENMPAWSSRPSPELLPENYVCIHVRDNGCGMNDEVKRKLFEPFFTTKPVNKGTGMGLAMAFGCISNHNGWIYPDSKIGAGTTFTIFLPRAGQK